MEDLLSPPNINRLICNLYTSYLRASLVLGGMGKNGNKYNCFHRFCSLASYFPLFLCRARTSLNFLSRACQDRLHSSIHWLSSLGQLKKLESCSCLYFPRTMLSWVQTDLFMIQNNATCHWVSTHNEVIIKKVRSFDWRHKNHRSKSSSPPQTQQPHNQRDI